MKRLIIGLLIAGVLIGACGGRADQPIERTEGPVDLSGLTLPAPKPATPVYLLSTRRTFDKRDVKKLERVAGVALASPISIDELNVKGPLGTKKLRVGAVDWITFRPVAPTSTRDADFVWTSLLQREAILTYEAADKLGVRDSTKISLDRRIRMSVGGFAANGVPNIFDVMVSKSVGDDTGIDRPRHVLVGATPGIKVDPLRERLKKAFPTVGMKALFQEKSVPNTPAPVGQAQGALIGAMTFQILKDGFIEPDPAWVSANIGSASVPLLGTVNCHRLMLPQLAAALGEVVESGLSETIRPSQYGGCYVPRFIMRDPRRGLSMHAFGLAIDLNVATNGYGTSGDMDPGVVAIFEKWGFGWGGRWSTPDPMHFEVVRVVNPG